LAEDLTLAREAQLLYNRAPEFKPAYGDLRTWRGAIPGRGSYRNMKFEVEITVSPGFPRVPPKVRMITPVDHPYVDDTTGIVRLSILSSWRPEYHIYQVINTVKGMFAQIPPKPSNRGSYTQPPADQRRAPVSSETGYRPTATPPPASPTSSTSPKPDAVNKLRQQISSLEDEVAHLKGKMTAHNVPEEGPDRLEQVLMPADPSQRQSLDLESEKIALEDLVRSLEEKYEAGDITPTDYAKLYRKYKKELFLIDKKLKDTSGT
jgi:ubiquitin-protein ligase